MRLLAKLPTFQDMKRSNIIHIQYTYYILRISRFNFFLHLAENEHLRRDSEAHTNE